MKGGDGHQCLSFVGSHHFLAAHPFLPGRACEVRGSSIVHQTAKLTKIININYLEYTVVWYYPEENQSIMIESYKILHSTSSITT